MYPIYVCEYEDSRTEITVMKLQAIPETDIWFDRLHTERLMMSMSVEKSRTNILNEPDMLTRVSYAETDGGVLGLLRTKQMHSVTAQVAIPSTM
jgi:hypothetical protein